MEQMENNTGSDKEQVENQDICSDLACTEEPKQREIQKKRGNPNPEWVSGKSGNPNGRPKGAKDKHPRNITERIWNIYEKAGSDKAMIEWINKSDSNRRVFYQFIWSKIMDKEANRLDINVEFPALSTLKDLLDFRRQAEIEIQKRQQVQQPDYIILDEIPERLPEPVNIPKSEPK